MVPSIAVPLHCGWRYWGPYLTFSRRELAVLRNANRNFSTVIELQTSLRTAVIPICYLGTAPEDPECESSVITTRVHVHPARDEAGGTDGGISGPWRVCARVEVVAHTHAQQYPAGAQHAQLLC